MARKTAVRLLVLPLLVALLCVGPALAEEPPDLTAQAALGSAFTYQGRLLDDNAPANGTYDFEFKLYDGSDPSTATQIGSTQTVDDGTVTNGLFAVWLDFGGGAFSGAERWLQVSVRPGASSDPYTVLSPLTKVTAAPYALGLRPGTYVSSDAPGGVFNAENGSSGANMFMLIAKKAIAGYTSDGSGVLGAAATGTGLYGAHLGTTGTNPGVRGITNSVDADAAGVHGSADSTAPTGDNAGVWGSNSSTNAFGYGVRGSHDGMGAGVYGTSVTGSGVLGSTTSPGLLNAGVKGVGTGGAVGVYAYSDTGDIITATSSGFFFGNLRFRVQTDGNVTADGAFTGGGADFAEMMPAEDGLEPGDLLAIGPDGDLVKAVGAYSTAVAGVYSTQPAFIGGGGGAEGEGLEGKVPLAIMGVVPAKASAENGAIAPGDLLTTSDTPGHVMKATDRDLMLGAVVGKALEGLDSGTGVISVLVTLQ